MIEINLNNGKKLVLQIKHTNEPAVDKMDGKTERKACTELFAKIMDDESVWTHFDVKACCRVKDNFCRSAGRRWAVQHLLDYDTSQSIKLYLVSRVPVGGAIRMIDKPHTPWRRGRHPSLRQAWLEYDNIKVMADSFRLFDVDDRKRIMAAVCPEFFTNIRNVRRASRLAKKLGMSLYVK